MAALVVLTGLLVAVIGLLGALRPQAVVAPIQAWQPHTRFYLAVGVRLVLGVVFVVAAPACRFPIIILGIGILALVAALALALVGARRLDSFMQWWFKQSAASLRLWFTVAVLFGALVLYSGT